MGLFNWLLVGHVIGDFIFQTRWMAEKKSSQWLPLIVHAVVYTAIVTALSFITKGLSIWGILIILIGHIILDQRTFTNFWADKVNGAANIDWLKITLDQSWHIVFLGVATLF